MYTLQPQKSSQGCTKILAIIGGVTVVLIACVFFGVFLPAITDATSSSASHAVEYKIRFSNGVSDPHMDRCATFDITYAMPSGTAQKEVESCAGVNAVAQFDGKRGDYLYLSIQNTAPRNSVARFSCIISVDGVTISEVQSVGWAHIASCDGRLP